MTSPINELTKTMFLNYHKKEPIAFNITEVTPEEDKMIRRALIKSAKEMSKKDPKFYEDYIDVDPEDSFMNIIKSYLKWN